MRRRVVTPATLLLLAGCAVPLPHFERQTPTISGSLTRSASPESRVPIRLIVGDSTHDCSGFWRETETSAQGQFSFSEKKRLFPFMLLVMAHTYYEWSVCIQEKGRFIPAIRLKEYTLTGVPGAGPWYPISIECDLGHGELGQQPAACLEPRYTFEEPISTCICQAYRIKQ